MSFRMSPDVSDVQTLSGAVAQILRVLDTAVDKASVAINKLDEQNKTLQHILRHQGCCCEFQKEAKK